MTFIEFATLTFEMIGFVFFAFVLILVGFGIFSFLSMVKDKIEEYYFKKQIKRKK